MKLEEEGPLGKGSAWKKAPREEVAKYVVGQENGIGERETKAWSSLKEAGLLPEGHGEP